MSSETSDVRIVKVLKSKTESNDLIFKCFFTMYKDINIEFTEKKTKEKKDV
jgi:hypothetical protein